MRIGILTAGGDCPGLNAAIRAVAKSLILAHGAEVMGIEDGFRGLIERRARPLGLRDVGGILIQGGTILGADNRTNPFQWRARGGADVSDLALEHARELGLDGLVVLGGDGTMSLAHRFQLKGLPIVGVPKTIDNDLVGTERTIGFDTAVAIAAESVDRIHTTTQSHHRVFIVETMGRGAGWLALHAGLASGADIILLPEIDFDPAALLAVCRKREAGGPRFTIIVAAEGARPVGGRPAIREGSPEVPESVKLGGLAERLVAELQPALESEVRGISLGHVQRGGTPTAADRVLATALGGWAASLVAAGRFGQMVAVQDGHLTTVPLERVAGQNRAVPLDSPLIAAALAVGVSLGTTLPPLTPAMDSAAPL